MIVYGYSNGSISGIRINNRLEATVQRDAASAMGLRISVAGQPRSLPSDYQAVYDAVAAKLNGPRVKWIPTDYDLVPYTLDEYSYQAWLDWEDWDQEYYESELYWFDFALGLNKAACIQACSAIAQAWLRACLFAGPAAPECMLAAEAFMIACVLMCELRY